jgi:hypothetical protein
MAAAAFLERCMVCSQWRHPWEMQHLPGGALRCFYCHQDHVDALQTLSTGDPPPCCAECRTPWEQLTCLTPDGNPYMYLHWKDGCYQMLCPQCSSKYAPKRLDLYGDTDWGLIRKLKGAK